MLKKYLFLSLVLSSLTAQTYAQVANDSIDDIDDCDEETQDCSTPGSIQEPVKDIYPYKPFTTERMTERLTALYEGNNYISNVYELERRGLNKANTKVQPWGGSFWPLNQGMIANNYQDKDYSTYILTLRKHIDWKRNVSDYKKRSAKIHPNIYNLEEEDLAKLSPAEKYDLLLGDTSFDLTNKIWNYAEKWGNEKKWGFLSAIDLPDGFRIPNANRMMALWEGICHGWAVAAGHSPRPEKTVNVTLPNGKKMPFYPDDIKALVSLMWANSTIQSNVIFEGNRCNKKYPDKDKHGRYIDTKKDRDDEELLPRCADVHPGIFHVAATNLIGVDGRSFVVDKNPTAAIANQPVSGYELVYFNPQTGKEGSLASSVISRKVYGKKDLFAESRNPESTHIVGVNMKLKYVNWVNPTKEPTNSVKDDKIKDINFNYDLELNAKGEVVGGQWRVRKNGKGKLLGNSTHQPDFFWVVPRDWKNYFEPLSNLPKWDFAKSTLPPAEFAPAARSAHSFIYEESKRFFSESPKCPAFPMDGGEPIKVECEFKYPRPQPLINVVDILLKESMRK